MKDKISKNIFISILVLIAIYIALSFYSNFDLVLSTLASFNWKFFPIILIIIYISFLLKFIKWQYYLNLSKVKIKLSDSFQIFMASLTMSVTPGKIGEVIKSYMIKELNGTSTSSTIPIIFAEKVTEIFALIFLVVVGLSILNIGVLIPIITLIVLSIFVFLVLNTKTSNWLLKKLSSIKILQKYIIPINISVQNSRLVLSPKPFALMFIMSLVIWLIECLGFYLILIKYDINISITKSFFTYLFSIFIGSISFLPAGLGITDGSITLLLSNFNVNEEIAISTAFIIRIATLWFPLIVGGFSIFKINKILKK
ncbi:MAG: flippase-like domain-containing protein [Bacteroidetes bacterium]|nr:flippase-like domain-containing protein [Bacteroidota bacterium]MBU1798087.1 flippase-like domain-containing protein [Bacteroidota bacterium]